MLPFRHANPQNDSEIGLIRYTLLHVCFAQWDIRNAIYFWGAFFGAKNDNAADHNLHLILK